MANTVYDFTCQTPSGQKKSLKDYQGKVLLVVNTASKCGFTPRGRAVYRGTALLYYELLLGSAHELPRR